MAFVKNQHRRHPSFKDITGNKYGMVTVIGWAESRKERTYYLCKCDCGNEKVIAGNMLKTGNTKSCGCQKNPKKHGMTGEKIHSVWAGMLSRCNNKNNPLFRYYGERGISVCDRWRKFENFYEDMGDQYLDGLSLDRFPNVNGNYEPGNCRWATALEQAYNRRTTLRVTIDGETKTTKEWSDVSGINVNTIRMRLWLGWDKKDAVFRPVLNNTQCL